MELVDNSRQMAYNTLGYDFSQSRWNGIADISRCFGNSDILFVSEKFIRHREGLYNEAASLWKTATILYRMSESAVA